jgi:hypothetical protein
MALNDDDDNDNDDDTIAQQLCNKQIIEYTAHVRPLPTIKMIKH